MTNRKIFSYTAFVVILWFGIIGCNAQINGKVIEKTKIIELAVERNLAQNEALRATVHVGILPKGAVIEVCNKEGEILGAISQYGTFPGQKTGSHVIALPKSLIVKNSVSLHIKLIDSDERAPTNKELEKVELSIIKIKD